MSQTGLQCPKCRAQKRIFWSKRLKVPLTALFVVTPVLFVLYSVFSDPWLKAVLGLAAFVSLVAIIIPMKIRCLRCEPQWLAEAWGGANYEKQ